MLVSWQIRIIVSDKGTFVQSVCTPVCTDFLKRVVDLKSEEYFKSAVLNAFLIPKRISYVTLTEKREKISDADLIQVYPTLFAGNRDSIN